MVKIMNTLLVRLQDVYGGVINEPIYLRLQRVGSSASFRAKLPSGTGSIELFTRDGSYHVFVDPPSYLPAQVFVTVPGSLVLTMVIDPERVDGIRFNESISELPHLPVGFAALDHLRQAGFLNVATKCRAVALPNGLTVWDYVQEILEIRQERCFCTVAYELRENVKNSLAEDLFHEVSDSLHHPPVGFDSVDSFKTSDLYGNLQLTFFVRDAGIETEQWVADIDIDDAAGLGHIFQVVRNKLGHRHTHPYDIHQILLQHQKLDTGYRLLLEKEDENA